MLNFATFLVVFTVILSLFSNCLVEGCEYPSLPILDRFRNPSQCNSTKPCGSGECVYLWLGISICCSVVKELPVIAPKPLLYSIDRGRVLPDREAVQKVLSERKLRLTADIQGKDTATLYPFKVVGTHSFVEFVSVPITRPTPVVIPASFQPSSLSRGQNLRRIPSSTLKVSSGGQVLSDDDFSDRKLNDITAVPYGAPPTQQQSTPTQNVLPPDTPERPQLPTATTISTGAANLPSSYSNSSPLTTPGLIPPSQTAQTPGFTVEPPTVKTITASSVQTSFKTDGIPPTDITVSSTGTFGPTANGYNIAPPLATTTASGAETSAKSTDGSYITSRSPGSVVTASTPVSSIPTAVATSLPTAPQTVITSLLPTIPQTAATAGSLGTVNTPSGESANPNPYGAPVAPAVTSGTITQSTGVNEVSATFAVSPTNTQPITATRPPQPTTGKLQPISPGYLLDHSGLVELIQPSAPIPATHRYLHDANDEESQSPPEPQQQLLVYTKATPNPVEFQ